MPARQACILLGAEAKPLLAEERKPPCQRHPLARAPLHRVRMAAMAPPLLSLQAIELTLGTSKLLNGAELIVSPGDRVCLVGRNGSGKSTLLKIAAGMLQPDAGVRFFQPGATVRYLPQEPDLSGFATTSAYVHDGLGPADDPYRAAALMESLGLDPDAAPGHLSGGEMRRVNPLLAFRSWQGLDIRHARGVGSVLLQQPV